MKAYYANVPGKTLNSEGSTYRFPCDSPLSDFTLVFAQGKVKFTAQQLLLNYGLPDDPSKDQCEWFLRQLSRLRRWLILYIQCAPVLCILVLMA